MTSRILPITLAALLTSTAMATNQGTKPHDNQHHDSSSPTSIAGAAAGASATSVAVAASHSESQAAAAGGSASQSQTANGGAGGAGGNGGQGGEGGSATQSQSADNVGNSQNITIQGARQIASLSQGSWAAPECGSGGNAGGSGGGGAGFLGAYWTPADCKLMMIANSWAHLGMYGEACKTLTATKTLRSAYKRYDLPLPDCAALIAALTATPAAVEPAAPDLSGYVRRDELPTLLKDRDDRILKQAVAK